MLRDRMVLLPRGDRELGGSSFRKVGTSGVRGVSGLSLSASIGRSRDRPPRQAPRIHSESPRTGREISTPKHLLNRPTWTRGPELCTSDPPIRGSRCSAGQRRPVNSADLLFEKSGPAESAASVSGLSLSQERAARPPHPNVSLIVPRGPPAGTVMACSKHLQERELRDR